MRSDIAPGRVFPDYELPDQTGRRRSLRELQGDDPLILTLARGHDCPKEHQQHLELAAFFDIQEYTDPEHNPMIPHTVVLKPGLVIHRIYNGYWFWGRPSVDDLRHDLRAVMQEIRPDWDLAAPGLRDAWNAGDFSRFHGWSKRGSGTTASPGGKG